MIWFYGDKNSAGSFLWRITDFKWNGNSIQNFCDTLVNKFLIDIFFSPAKCQLNLNSVAFFEKFFGLFRFEYQVMHTGAKASTKTFDFHLARFLLRFARFFVELVLVFTKIHDASDRRFCIRRDLNKIETGFPSKTPSLFKRLNAEVFTFGTDDP